MAKKSKLLTFLVSFLCFVLGAVIGTCALLWHTLPDSYEIPEKKNVIHSHAVAGEINVQTVKEQNLSIHFLELGNKYTGDCTLIKVGDVEMLIDAGSKASSITAIQSYLDTYVEGDLDYVVVTHAHEDHYAGFATNENTESLFDLNTVKNIIDFGDGTNKTLSNKMYANYKRERDAEVDNGAKYIPVQDYFKTENPEARKFELGTGSNVFVEILYQKFYNAEAETENDYSVCLQIVYQNKYYLFTGDLEAEGEESLVEENEAGGKNEGLLHEVEVYKAGHHGSKTSSTETLMNVIKPKVVCVCCCAGSSEYTSKNENQFPTQIFINNVYKSNPLAKIYVTTLCVDYKANEYTSFNGNIVITAKEGVADTIVHCSKSAVDLYNTDWFKANRTLPEIA